MHTPLSYAVHKGAVCSSIAYTWECMGHERRHAAQPSYQIPNDPMGGANPTSIIYMGTPCVSAGVCGTECLDCISFQALVVFSVYTRDQLGSNAFHAQHMVSACVGEPQARLGHLVVTCPSVLCSAGGWAAIGLHPRARDEMPWVRYPLVRNWDETVSYRACK